MPRRHCFLAASWLLAFGHCLAAEDVLDTVVVTGLHYDTGVGTSDAASEGVINAALIENRAVLRPGEILEFVPGLVVTQHSGDGKANQYFLRGFNLDHGTDFATSVQGMPVNMPTHGHGQGYSDLNFLIPELVQRIEYRKGPYFARNGDFSSAGSADVGYRRRFDTSFATFTGGENGYRRGVLGASGTTGNGLDVLVGVEGMQNAGPWTLDENLSKWSGVLSVTQGDAFRGWRIDAMGYHASWASTDQIPERLIMEGQFQGRPFGRFDAVDGTDGGDTHRYSLSAEWHSKGTRAEIYAIDYRLRLFSNFTYALDRPAAGDQFSQADTRRVYGGHLSQSFDVGAGRLEAGGQIRHDRINVGLFDTERRVITATTRQDEVRETLGGAYLQLTSHPTTWLRSIVGMRADAARFEVRSAPVAADSGSDRDHLVSPKLSLIFGPWARSELFFNYGRGFHSNDARGTTTTIDPKTGDDVEPVPGLVGSRGFEIGARTEVVPGLQTSLALWALDFDSELVYVGDAGTTEPNRPSRRRGIEWNNHYTGLSWFAVDLDVAWTHARFKEDAPEGNYVPNSVDRVASAGITLPDLAGWSASLQWRYLGPGPLIEDNSVRSRPNITTNARASRRFGGVSSTLEVFNLFNRQVDDIEYYYESQLPGAAEPVADLHIHPGEPRTFRASLTYRF